MIMKSKSIHVFARWTVKEGQVETVLSLLRDVVKKSRQEEGNLLYKVHQSNSNPNVILLFEEYKDAPAQAKHRESEHFQKIVLEQIVPLLEHRDVTLATQLDFDQP